MPIYLAIFLGLLQGITEFLPVSSSGHLILAQALFNMPESMLMFNIILHLATLLAVVIVFRKIIWELVTKPFCKTNLCLLLATAITVTIVLVFHDLIDRSFNSAILPVTFMVTAVVLFATSLVSGGKKKESDEEGQRDINSDESLVTPGVAGLAGFAQGIAVIPGLSRSGFTISACLLGGADRTNAARFSFLMSIPIIVASFVFELVRSDGALQIDVIPTLIAFVVALVSGILAIKFMLEIVKRIKLYWFSLYLVVLAVVTVFVL